MRTPRKEFIPGTLAPAEAADGYPTVCYAIAVEGKTVIHNRSNGQSFFMLYRTQAGAGRMIRRVQSVLPHAEIVGPIERRLAA